MGIKGENIASIIKSQIETFEYQTELVDIGTVVEVGDGVARIHGLSGVGANELVEFEGGISGIALNLAASLFFIAVRRSAGDMPERIPSASLGPTLLMVINFSNMVCSSSVRNPKSFNSSSRTLVWMRSDTDSPGLGKE